MPSNNHDNNRQRPITPPPRGSKESLETDAKPTRGPSVTLPRFVYVSIFAASAWILIAIWATFGGSKRTDFLLGIVTFFAVFFSILFALPAIVGRSSEKKGRGQEVEEFLSAPVDTATERLTGAQAWVQILIIPVSLAIAATLIGIVYLIISTWAR